MHFGLSRILESNAKYPYHCRYEEEIEKVHPPQLKEMRETHESNRGKQVCSRLAYFGLQHPAGQSEPIVVYSNFQSKDEHTWFPSAAERNLWLVHCHPALADAILLFYWAHGLLLEQSEANRL